MSGWYSPGVVAMSVLIAIFASYAALDLAQRTTAARGWVRSAWLTGGATAMAIGIWSMHFTGMLAFHLPIPISYDWPTSLASYLPAVCGSAFSLYLVSRPQLGIWRTLIGGFLLGDGIAGMHYTAMASLRLSAMCRFSAGLVTLSVVLAIVQSVAGLRLGFYFRNKTEGAVWRKIASAIVLGGAISIMHYTGMAAESFIANNSLPDISHAVSISSLATTGIGVVAIMVQGLAVFTSVVDRRFAAHAQAEELLHELSASILRSQDEERRRIARQLHETVAQSLVGLKMILEKICRAPLAADASVKVDLMEGLDLTEQCQKEIRTLSYLLHPPLLDEVGLASALRWYVTGFAERSGIATTLEIPPDLDRMPEEIEIAVFRIVQECLTNVHRHSGSTTAKIRIRRDRGKFLVEVEDDGRGMAVDPSRESPTLGVGISGIRERAKQLGGKLEIHSSPNGTTISVSLPLRGGALWQRSAS